MRMCLGYTTPVSVARAAVVAWMCAAALDASHRAPQLLQALRLPVLVRSCEAQSCMLPCTDVFAAGYARVCLLLLPLELLQKSQCRSELRSHNCACLSDN